MRKKKWIVTILFLLCIWSVLAKPATAEAADILYTIEDCMLYENMDLASQPYGIIARGSEITQYDKTEGFIKVNYGGKTGYILAQNVTKEMEAISPRSDGSISVNKIDQIFPMRNIEDFRETGSATLSLYTLLRDPEETYVYVRNSDDLVVYGSLFSCAYINQAQGFSIVYAAEECTVSVFYPAFEVSDADLERAYDISFSFDGETFVFQDPSLIDQMESKPVITINREGSTIAKATQNGRELELSQSGNKFTILLNDASEVSIEYETANVEEEKEPGTGKNEIAEEIPDEMAKENTPSNMMHICGLVAAVLVFTISAILLFRSKKIHL